MNTSKERQVLKTIIKAALTTHDSLRSQALKALYQPILTFELEKQGMSVKRDQIIYLFGKNDIDRVIKIDMIVEDMVIVLPQTKTDSTDIKRARSYVNLAGKKVALLINFSENTLNLEKGIVLVYGKEPPTNGDAKK